MHHGVAIRARTVAYGIPAYDAQRTGRDDNSLSTGNEDAPTLAEPCLLQDLQKAVNTARRTETRVKKIPQERQLKTQQWKSWEADLRRTYAREKTKYTSALERLETEMQQALHAQEQACIAVRQVACGAQDVEVSPVRLDADRELDALMNAVSIDPWDGEDQSQDAVLRRALEETMNQGAGYHYTHEVYQCAAQNASASRATSHAEGGEASHTDTRTCLSRAASSRMVPFPPPAKLSGDQVGLGDQPSPELATMDLSVVEILSGHGYLLLQQNLSKCLCTRHEPLW